MTTLLKPVDQYICGINPAKAQLNKIKEVLKEVSNAQVAAKDMVKLRVRDRIEKLERKLKCNEKRNESQALTSRRARKIDDTISLIKNQIAREKEILNRTAPYQSQRYQQRVKRIVIKLIKENPMENRKLGAGPRKMLLDSEDEEYVAWAIESMYSAHGKRTDHVMYLNLRLKCNDLLSIANNSLAFRVKTSENLRELFF